MNKNVEAFKKYYANATKEEVIEDMFLDNCNLQERIDKAIEILKLCNSNCARETIEILKGDNNEC